MKRTKYPIRAHRHSRRWLVEVTNTNGEVIGTTTVWLKKSINRAARRVIKQHREELRS